MASDFGIDAPRVKITNDGARPVETGWRRIPHHPAGKKITGGPAPQKLAPGETIVHWVQAGTMVTVR